MRRSGSRASKISTDAQDSLENSFPGIPVVKWHEFLEKEETELFILGLREEIIQKCMEICYDNYLEKQAVAFTVHCAYLAWCKVLNIYYMVRDPGDTDDSKEKNSWEPDLEPEPSIIDSWGSQCIKTLIEPEPPAQKVEKESDKEICVRQSLATTMSNMESMDSCSFISDLFNVQEGEYFFSITPFSVFGESDRAKKKPLFSSTLCTSLDSLSDLKTFDEEQIRCGHVEQKSRVEK